MKSEEEANDARMIVIERQMEPGLSPNQRLLLQGMSVALCWVCGGPYGSTLEKLIKGEKIVKGV
jgi:hypothetical protein